MSCEGAERRSSYPRPSLSRTVRPDPRGEGVADSALVLRRGLRRSGALSRARSRRQGCVAARGFSVACWSRVARRLMGSHDLVVARRLSLKTAEQTRRPAVWLAWSAPSHGIRAEPRGFPGNPPGLSSMCRLASESRGPNPRRKAPGNCSPGACVRHIDVPWRGQAQSRRVLSLSDARKSPRSGISGVSPKTIGFCSQSCEGMCSTAASTASPPSPANVSASIE